MKFNFTFSSHSSAKKSVSSLLILGIFTVLMVALSAFTTRPGVLKEATAILQRPLEENIAAVYFVNPTHRISLSKALSETYNANNFQLLWLEGSQSSARLDSLVLALKGAVSEGLNPETYHLARIERLKAEAGVLSDAAQIAELDQLATAAYLLYASHLYNGSIPQTELGANWHIQAKNILLAQHLQKAIANNNIQQSLTNLSGVNPGYAALKNELAHLQVIAKQGGWPLISAVAEAETLKRRLILAGDLDSTATVTGLTLNKALGKFQQRHGLPVSGKVDQRTLTALNVPVEARIEQVKINLERMRWLPRPTGNTVISVNIPDFKLRVMDKNKQVLESRVVVGKLEFATPIFEDSLESIVFSPEWNVPNQIATEEILPKLQENPGYLRKNNFEVYDSYRADAKPIDVYSVNWNAVTADKFKYRFVQKTNPKNALGAVKFLFPNPLNIYIHDTPAKHLFKENKRAYSHGCIRLENPAKLAASLLKKDFNWTDATISEKMNATQSTKVQLNKAVKVEIMYLTAFVQDGHLQFRDDLYGYDQSQIKTLQN